MKPDNKDTDELYNIIYEKDQRNVAELHHRIVLANKLASEIDDLIFSGKQLSASEWKDLKDTAERNKLFLIKLQKDPKLINLCLHLKDNRDLSKSLTNKLRKSISDSLDRLNASISVISNEVKVGKKSESNLIDLELSDVLVPGILEDQVYTIWKKFNDTVHKDGKQRNNTWAKNIFLKHLIPKGYYKRKLYNWELELIGKRFFPDEGFKVHRTGYYIPIAKGSEGYSNPPYSVVPEAKSIIKNN